MNEPQKGAGDGARKPSKASILKAAAQDQCDLALDTLVGLMKGQGPDSVRLAAAREVLDRAHGKTKPAGKRGSSKAPDKTESLTIIVKKHTDITPEEEAAAEATARGEL